MHLYGVAPRQYLMVTVGLICTNYLQVYILSSRCLKVREMRPLVSLPRVFFSCSRKCLGTTDLHVL